MFNAWVGSALAWVGHATAWSSGVATGGVIATALPAVTAVTAPLASGIVSALAASASSHSVLVALTSDVSANCSAPSISPMVRVSALTLGALGTSEANPQPAFVQVDALPLGAFVNCAAVSSASSTLVGATTLGALGIGGSCPLPAVVRVFALSLGAVPHTIAPTLAALTEVAVALAAPLGTVLAGATAPIVAVHAGTPSYFSNVVGVAASPIVIASAPDAGAHGASTGYFEAALIASLAGVGGAIPNVIVLSPVPYTESLAFDVASLCMVAAWAEAGFTAVTVPCAPSSAGTADEIIKAVCRITRTTHVVCHITNVTLGKSPIARLSTFAPLIVRVTPASCPITRLIVSKTELR